MAVISGGGGGAPSGAAGGDLGGTYPNPTVNDGADSTAIHDDTGSEISAITEKASPVAADLLLIEDSEATNAKKKVQIGNLPATDYFDKFSRRNWGAAWSGGNTSALFATDNTQVAHTDTSSANRADSDGMALIQTSNVSTSGGTFVGFSFQAVLPSQLGVYRWRISIERITDIRLFIGFCNTNSPNGTPSESDDPSVAYAGIQFSTARPDTNWQLVSKATAAGSQVGPTDTGTAPTTGVHLVEGKWLTATSVQFRLLDPDTGAEVADLGTISSGIPTELASFRWWTSYFSSSGSGSQGVYHCHWRLGQEAP